MPCEKGQVVHVENSATEAPAFTQRLTAGTWFGFAKFEIEVPRHLWRKFEEMCQEVPAEVVPKHVTCRTPREPAAPARSCWGLFPPRKCWSTPPPPLLKWYVAHAAEIKAVFRTIDYESRKIFTWFAEEVTEARRTGDAEKSKELLTEVLKLLGNSEYEKMSKPWRAGRTNTS